MRSFGDDAPCMMPESVDGVKRGAKKQHTFITDLSSDKRDRAWDKHKAASEDVAEAYMRLAVSRVDCCGHMVSETEADARMFKVGRHMQYCATSLEFAETDDGLKLTHAQFCRKKECPECAWRRSMRWKRRMWEALPKIVEACPEGRWLFLTLTIRNCDLQELRKPTLQTMNRGWNRLLKREDCSGVLGYLRTTEITRGKDNSAHPHFHALLLVKPSMLTGRGYVPQKRWTEMWRECCGLDYDPIVDIRTVKERNAGKTDDTPEGVSCGLARAVKEVVKYTTKEGMNVGKKTEVDRWYYELMKQLHGAHLISSGGMLKDVLKITKRDEDGEETNDELIGAKDKEEEKRDVSALHGFKWHKDIRRYVHSWRTDGGSNF